MATSYPKASLSKLRPLLPEQEDPLARILQNSSQLPPESSGDELAQLLQAVSSAPPRFQTPKVPLVLAPQKPAMRAPKPPMKLPIRGPMQGPAPMPSDIAAAQANQVPTPEANPIEATPAQTYKAVMPQLPDAARGSGDTFEGSNTSTIGEKHNTTSNTYDLGEMDKVLEYIRGTPEMEGLRGHQSQLENMLRMEQDKPNQLDLTPLMALTDQWSGSNLAKSYKAPADKAARILAFQEKLGDNQRDIFKTLTDAVTKLQTGKQSNSQMAQIAAMLKATNVDPAIAEAKARAGKTYDPNKDVQKLGENRSKYGPGLIQSLENINEVLAPQGGIAGLEAQLKSGKEIDIPGVGLAASLTPSALLSGQGSKMYQAALDLALAKLQLRSGAQASETEAARYLTGLGLTRTSGPRETAQGLLKLTKEIKQQLASDEARFATHPEVYQIYSADPGAILSKHLDKYLVSGPNAKDELKKKMAEIEQRLGIGKQ